MQSERWRTCTEIFHAAVERPPHERAAFVEQSCAGDADLRRQVEKLLRYHDDAGDFIASPVYEDAAELFGDDPGALIGQHLGSYRIDAVLGVGGMGVVYLACDEKLGRKVGLKLLPRALVNDEAQLERLKLEARTASALNHPNIVTVHEVGQVDSTYYIAIEFIEGSTLRERIARGAIPAWEAVEIATQVASALCVAHEAGIVHRDIKPENIMIRPDGYVKVLDFGIAKSAHSEVGGTVTAAPWELSTRTQRGVVLGTMRYASPEQARGENVDTRSDVWSLGVVLYEMLTSRAPFDGSSPSEVRAAVKGKAAPPLSEIAVPTALQHIIDQCLQKDPAERYQTSAELLADLRALNRSSAPAARALQSWRLFGIGAAIVGLIVAAFYITGYTPGTGSRARPNDSFRKSIAVLPFADLSPNRDQQYFSDGMSEEILNALAQVEDLKVTGRSSSFAFRGREQDMRSIGATLGVAHVLEGSVRKQGDKVRITAQLIQASDGFHVWSQTYDADVRDVFSLQERIARAIAEQLRAVLHPEQKSQLVKTATVSSEAYALYLQATAIFNRRDSARFADAVAQLKEAVRLDPKFARAHARLASLAAIMRGYDVELPEDISALIMREARLAIELDATLAEPHAALGQLLYTQRRFSEARAAYDRALAIDGNDVAANLWLATLLNSGGYLRESARILDKILANDPVLPNALLWRGFVHMQLGELDEADRTLRRAADAGITSVGLAFAHVAQARGDDAALVHWLAPGLKPFVRDLPEGTSELISAGITGEPSDRAAAIAAIDAYLATNPQVLSAAVPLALMWLGQPERALAVAQEKPTRNDTVFLPSLWTAASRSTRALAQFSAFADRSGLAELWDKTGPPDSCRKETGGYVCE